MRPWIVGSGTRSAGLKFVIEAVGLTVAGGKELALDLMSRLASHKAHEFILVMPDLEDYNAISGSNIRSIVCKQGSGLLHRARLLNYEVPKICREEDADALLCLGNFVPWKRICPTAVLLQNAWIVYGDPVADARRTLREHLITAYGRHAYRHLHTDIIITQTQVMKDHLCRRYGISPGRVAIIPNTLSRAKLGSSHDQSSFLGRDGANHFRFLCLAHCYAHKNIDILLDAAQRLPNFTDKSAKCVITVAPEQHPGARRLLERLDRGEAAGKIENIGPVPSEMLPEVYHRADALIFPTLLESFSRTYLEAMYFGLPILTSDRDFARNLCRNAAIYFDPLDADSVARAMARVMDDVDLRQRLVEKGQRVLAQSPTWDEIAARFVEVLERTARGKEGSRQWGVGSREWGVGGREEAEGRKQKAIRSRQQAGSSGLVAVGSGSNPSHGFHPASSEGDPENKYGQASLNSETGRKGTSARPRQELDLNHLALPTANCLLPSAFRIPPSDAVRTLFNHKARGWRSKYGSRGTLSSRVEQFAARLAGLCLPPAGILDFGCGTGEIAAAIDRMGYQVTACDFAEEMIAVARSNYSETAVKWVRLESDWKMLPFADASFDGIIASSVFEYLDDVPRVAEELFRVLRPEGVLLLTVPNPHNVVRKIEARLRAMSLMDRSSHLLRRVQRLDSYATYLRLSRNRFEAQGWQSVLSVAHFAPLEEREFSPEAWQGQSRAPLVLLAVKRMAVVESGQFDAETTLCRSAQR